LRTGTLFAVALNEWDRSFSIVDMATQETQGNVKDVVLAVSLELAAAKWKVALHDGHRESPSIYTVAQTDPATRLQAVLALIATQKQAWALPDNTRVVVSY
jgi:transposase